MGNSLFPKEVIENIRAGGDKEAFAKAGYKTLKGGSYRSMWWVFHNKHGAFAARGVHGQTIYVDPTAEMVIVRFASFPGYGRRTRSRLTQPRCRPIKQWPSI
jgi:CubicO group peptidase (beta-lactamase class C family)